MKKDNNKMKAQRKRKTHKKEEIKEKEDRKIRMSILSLYFTYIIKYFLLYRK